MIDGTKCQIGVHTEDERLANTINLPLRVYILRTRGHSFRISNGLILARPGEDAILALWPDVATSIIFFVLLQTQVQLNIVPVLFSLFVRPKCVLCRKCKARIQSWLM